MTTCPSCGSPLFGRPRFCDQCGVPLAGEGSPTVPAPPQREGITIGRADDNVIVVPWNAPGVSRYHARVVIVGERMYIEDAGTRNGTWLNGHRVQGSTPFSLADEVRLGQRYLLNKAEILAAKLER